VGNIVILALTASRPRSGVLNFAYDFYHISKWGLRNGAQKWGVSSYDPTMTSRKALFLDRDGVINVDSGYVHRRDQFVFIDGIFELSRRAKQSGYLIFVVTNQAGIARGLYTEHDFRDLMMWMCEEFQHQGASIDKVYYCPYHPKHGIGEYKRESSYRKPNPGMMLAAAQEFGVSLTSSVLVGDKDSDIEAGLSAGVGCNVLFRPAACGRLLGKEQHTVRSLRDVIGFLE
jgi:D-glycero-D-manno-heptose 1,7-bisphosphate phosphatase